MSAKDIVLKTRFEKQIPFLILLEISEAVKKSELESERLMYPDEEIVDRLFDAIDNLNSVGTSSHTLIKVIAEGIRYLKTFPDVKR